MAVSQLFNDFLSANHYLRRKYSLIGKHSLWVIEIMADDYFSIMRHAYNNDAHLSKVHRPRE